MMHRAGRAKLLLPSFIAVLGACGGATVGTGADAGGPNLAGGAGGTAGIAGAPSPQNPPPPNYPGGSGGTAGGQPYLPVAGGGANPPFIEHAPCPVVIPTAGTACAGNNYDCTYNPGCGIEYAECSNGTWSLAYTVCEAGDAGPDLPPPPPPPPPPTGPLSCPLQAPADGTSCPLPGNIISYECDYGCTPQVAICKSAAYGAIEGLWKVSGSPYGGCSGI